MKWASAPCNQLPCEALLMRVSSCKFLRPSLICFTKTSVGHYPPSTLELEDAQHASGNPAPVPDALEVLPPEEKIELEKVDDVKVETLLKSSIKKPTESGSEGAAKGRVKWMDFMGKELVEIKEFDASDSGDSDDEDGNRGCFCTIQ